MLNTQARASKDESHETSFARQGSLRRVIPSGHKENLFGRQNEDLNKLYKVFHQEYLVLAEYKMLQSENMQGIYVIPSKESCLTWFGVIFIRSGIYEDGIFRFNVILPESYPDGGHPKVVFQSDIYHPVIHNDTNELYLLDAFPLWNKTEQHIWQILKYIHWIFYNFNASLAHSINKEAADLYKKNQDEFKEIVRSYVKMSQERIYNPPVVDDEHYLTFERYDPHVHDAVKARMLVQNKEENSKTLGHSWVNPGSFKPLNRPATPVSEGET